MSLFIPNAISMLIEYKSGQYIKSKPYHVVIAMTALSSLIISFFTNLLVFYRLAIASSVPIFILSGFTWPLKAMPLLVQKGVLLLPFTYLADNLRSLMLSGEAPHLYQDIAVLFAYGLVMLSLSIYRYKKMRFAKQVKAPV